MQNKKRFIIHPNNRTGRKLYGAFFITVWLLLDRLHATEWLWGIYWFLVGLNVLGFVIDLFRYDDKMVNIETILKDRWEAEHQENGLPKYHNPPPPPKKTFDERVEEIKNRNNQ